MCKGRHGDDARTKASDSCHHGCVEEFELPDGRRVRVLDNTVLRQEDHDDCAFCLGRAAAHRGELAESNPFPPTDAEPSSTRWYESEFGQWEAGYSVGTQEPGGLLWFE